MRVLAGRGPFPPALPERAGTGGRRLRPLPGRPARAAAAAARRRAPGARAARPAGRRHAPPGVLRAVLRRLGYRVHGWRLGPQHRPDRGLRDRACRTAHRRPHRPLRRAGQPDRLEPRRHLRPRPRPPDPRLGAPGDHPRQPVPAGPRTARAAPPRCSTATRTCTSSTARCRWSARRRRCPCPRPRSTRTSTASCTGRPAWTPPASAARTSPSWPATSVWATTRRRSTRSPTGSPSPPAPGSRSARRSFLRPAFPRPDQPAPRAGVTATAA